MHNKLTTLKIKNASPGKYNDGAGLWLHKRADGGAQWFVRITVHGRRREMGLGPLHEVSLKEARELASRARGLVRRGIDPIKEREKQRRAASKADSSLSIVAQAAYEARQAELKGDGKAGRWFSPLELHVLPKLGKVPVEELDQTDIQRTLKPIWHSKGETARKAITRLGVVLKHGAAMGYDVDLQAVDKAKALLGKSRQERKHIPALPWQEVPTFYASLQDTKISVLALKLLILTAARSGPIRKARWEQIEDDTWVIPGENMKAKKGYEKDFLIPLSTAALEVLAAAKPFEADGYIFPGNKRTPISDMAMTKFLNDQGHDFRPHGFRSSFRTWVSEATEFDERLAEAALAHTLGNKVERSYNRTEYLDRRRELMEAWGSYVRDHSE